MSDVEIVTKLTLDTVADKMLERIKDGLTGVQEGEEKAKDAGDSWLDSAITKSHELGFELREMVDRVAEFAMSFVDVAADGNAADTAVAGLIKTAQGQSWDNAFDSASAMGDSMDVIAEKAGVAGDSVGDAFQTMLEISGATEKGMSRAQDQVEQLARVAGVLGKDTGGIAREFAMMGEGVLRTKGQLFQLLKTTGIFGDDIKKAAEEWGKLTDEQRANRLDAGLTSLTDKLADAKPSFNQLRQSLVDMYETGKEKLGEPLMNALIPVLESVKHKLEAAMPAIEEFAQKIGPEVAEWVDKAFETVQDAATYIADNWDAITSAAGDIFDGIKEAFGLMWNAIKFLVDHKEVVMALLALNAVKNVGQGAVAGFTGGKAGEGMGAELGAQMGGLVKSFNDLRTNGVSPVTAAFAGIAIVAATGVEIWSQFNDAAKDFADTQKKGREAREKEAASGDIDSLKMILHTQKTQLAVAQERMGQGGHGGSSSASSEDLIANAGDYAETKRLAEKYAQDIRETQALIDAAITEAAEKSQQTAEMAATQKRIDEAKFTNDYLNMISAEMEVSKTHSAAAQAYVDNMAVNVAGQIIAGYNAAILAHDQATATYYANILAGDTELQKAFQESGAKIEGGLGGLALSITSGTTSFVQSLIDIGGSFADKKPEPPKVSLSGGGPVTINIKQDYRDQDPDRVAVVFQRDLEKAAYRRLSSMNTTPFGT